MKVKLSSIWRVTLALALVLGISLVAAVPSLAALPANPTAPTLGEAGRYVILASQTITTTGTTAISGGDIGILDQARSYLLTGGFTPVGPAGDFTQLTGGTSHAWDDAVPAPFPIPLHYSTPVIGAPWAGTNKVALINQSRTDLGIAYTFLAADPNPGAPTQACPAELGGQTLTRGVYKTATDVLISTPLSLDAQGDPNSVWIFSIGGNLATGASGNISFVGGIGSANNVYWRVGGTTTIAGGTTFYGNVVNWAQVNVLAGANITGKLFSVNEQVTLISDAVTMPALLTPYTVTFDLGSHGTLGSGTLVQTVNSGAGATAPVVTANAGWNFTGWDVAFNNVTSNLTVNAQYSQITYTVTFNNNTGSGTMSPQSANYNTPTALTLNTFTKTGYSFAGWNTVSGGGGTSYADGANYPFTASVTLYAQWPINSYTITFNSEGGSAVTAITQNYGTSVSAPTAPTLTGDTFGGWYSDSGLTTPYTFGTMPASNTTLYAKWNVNSYTVTFNNNLGTGVAPSSESATFGQLVTAPTVLPTYIGNALSGWNTVANGTGTTWNFGTTTMGAGAMTLYAQWNLAPTVISTVPANAAIGVAINSAMTATFSTTMDSSTILAPGTFTLKQGSTPIGGTVSYAGVTATFQPTVSLAYNTTYTATISTAAQDTAGTHLAAPYVWTFTTQRPVSVGGQAYPINTTTILVSALILAIIVTLGARVLVLRRRAGR